MSRTGTHRRLVALVAAYALALQALLSAVIAVSPAAALGGVICSAEARGTGGAGDGPVPPPAGHALGCAVCPLACGGAVPLSSLDAANIVLTFGAGQATPLRRAAAPPAPVGVRVGLARAPPA